MAIIAVGTRLGLHEVHHLDPLIAIGVGLVITRAAWDIMRRSYDHLMDRSLPQQEVAKIAALLEGHVDLHVVVPGGQSVAEAHALSDHLENDLQALLPNLEVLIHVEPREETD